MQTRLLAAQLGYAGLIPFIALSFAAWFEVPLLDRPHFLLQTYAAVILAFMGAIHWGAAMSKEDRLSATQLGLSVLPPLLAWLALMLPQAYGYSLFIVSFVLLCIFDGMLGKHGRVPSWYVPMRIRLTTVVVICLILAALAAVIR
jgi:hypothetical protein